MDWDSFLAHSMDPAFMALVRARLVHDNSHFIHRTHKAHLEGITARGLIAQAHTDVATPSWVMEAGRNNELLFFTPGHSPREMGVTGADVLLAIPSAALPTLIGLDWTFRDALDCAAAEYERTSPTDLVRFAADFMTEYSSVLCYEGVQSSDIHRWNGEPLTVSAPLSWARL